MRFLFSAALAVLFCFSANYSFAQSADASKLPKLKYKQLSKVGKKALKSLSTDLCGCLQEHGEGLQTMMDAVRPILEDANAGPMEVMGAMIASASDMEEFNQCMESVEPDKDMEDVLEKEIDLILGEDADDDTRMKMQMQIINVGLKKHCKKQQPAFEGFLNVMMELQEKMSNIQDEPIMEDIDEMPIEEED